jgi:hypothetical protein
MIGLRATIDNDGCEEATMKSVETMMDEAVGEHWDAVITANDRLLSRFDEIVREACPSLRFVAESNEDGLATGAEYAIALDYCYVVCSPDVSEGARVLVELHRLDGDGNERPIDVDHVALLDHLGLLDD